MGKMKLTKIIANLVLYNIWLAIALPPDLTVNRGKTTTVTTLAGIFSRCRSNRPFIETSTGIFEFSSVEG